MIICIELEFSTRVLALSLSQIEFPIRNLSPSPLHTVISEMARRHEQQTCFPPFSLPFYNGNHTLNQESNKQKKIFFAETFFIHIFRRYSLETKMRKYIYLNYNTHINKCHHIDGVFAMLWRVQNSCTVNTNACWTLWILLLYSIFRILYSHTYEFQI